MAEIPQQASRPPQVGGHVCSRPLSLAGAMLPRVGRALGCWSLPCYDGCTSLPWQGPLERPQWPARMPRVSSSVSQSLIPLSATGVKGEALGPAHQGAKPILVTSHTSCVVLAEY